MPSNAWIQAAAAATAIVGATAVYLWHRGTRRAPKHLPSEWPLMQRPVFSSIERALYQQLRTALPNHTVLAKLPLVRFCQPIESQDLRYWFELLGPIHVSFVVCASNGRALAAIDIDKPERKVSERTTAIKQAVLEACHIRYVKCRADQLPTAAELQLLVPAQGDQARPQVPKAHTGTDQRATLAHTMRGPRRPPAGPRWPESGFSSDSFFAPEGTHEAAEGAASEFMGSRYPAEKPTPSTPSARTTRPAPLTPMPPPKPVPTAPAPLHSFDPTAPASVQSPAPVARTSSSPIPFPGTGRPATQAAAPREDEQALREELRRGIRQDLRLEMPTPKRPEPVSRPNTLDLRLDPMLRPPAATPNLTKPRSPAPSPAPTRTPQSGFGPNIMPLHRVGPGPNNTAGTLAEDLIGRRFAEPDSLRTSPPAPRPGDNDNVRGRN